MGKSIAMVWHQGIMGHNDEDIVSSFIKFMREEVDRDCVHLVLWMDNCGPQNKNWTLFSTMIAIINSKDFNLKSITFKYFEAGHTYMSADSFHHQVEKECQQMGSLYDFDDFVRACNESGRAVQVKPEDFYKWEKQLSEGKVSKPHIPIAIR